MPSRVLYCSLLLGTTGASAWQVHHAPVTPLHGRAPASRMQGTVPSVRDWTTVVADAQARAATVKDGQDDTAAAMATGTLAVFALPLIENNFVADLFVSFLIGGLGVGFLAGFRDTDAVGDAARSVGRTVRSATAQVDASLSISKKIKEIMPGDGEEGLSMADIKKYGVAGTLAYILTELAFWAVAFPVASATFYNTAGHWPDFGDGGDRAAVLAFIFAGANVARLVVPLRFGAAFALAPWVDENIVQKFGLGGGDDEGDSSP
jgi:hypothetical protein